MNLIEQLGGYEKASEDFKKLHLNLKEQQKSNKVFMDAFDALKTELLEYRRQHNIYEAGDLVIKTHPKNTILWPVLGVYKNGGVWLDYKGFCWKSPRVRHATEAEIKAGKRLEVS